MTKSETKGESEMDLRLRIKQLEDTLSAERESKAASLSFKVSGKSGVISLYGLQRMPISLYRTGWVAMQDRLVEIVELCGAKETHLDHVADLAKEWKGYKGTGAEKEWLNGELANQVAKRINSYLSENFPVGSFKECPIYVGEAA